MSVSKRTRFEVLRRDNHTCRYCGGTAPEVVLTVDHVNPVALGGTDDPSNLVAACRDCNAGKASTGPDEHTVSVVSEDAVRWAAALAEAARIASAQVAERNAFVEAADAAWGNWTYGGYKAYPLPRPDGWRQSVLGWRDAGLSIDAVIEAINIAAASERVSPNDTWRYMCGVAWSKVREIQRVAEEIVKAGGADGA